MMRRWGLVIPSSNTTMEREFYQLLHPHFSVHTARMRLKEVTAESLARMEKEVEKESLKLKDAQVEVIGYGCTSGSLIKGMGHDKAIEEKIEKCCHIPAVATTKAVVDALKVLHARKIAVATPYIDEINSLEEKFLLENSFEVVDFKGLKIKENVEIGKLTPGDAYQLAMELNFKEADAIFISCTNFSTIEIIEKLEKQIEKPVISSNIATLWGMFKKCTGKRFEIKGCGVLLTEKMR